MKRPADRQAHIKWEDHLKAIRRATPVDHSEDVFAKEQRKAALLADFTAFCNHYFPHYCSAPFGDFHLEQAKLVWDNEREVFVFEMARAHAKSVLHGVLNPIYMMVRGMLRTMVLTSWSESNATFLLGALRAELEANERLISDFGPFVSSAMWTADEFITRDNVYFASCGSGQSPRGVRNGERRPDYVLADDFDEDEQSRNPDRVDAAEEWLFGAFFGTLDITGPGRFVIIGNRIARDCVLVRAIPRAGVYRQVNLLDNKGRPSWHQRYTRKDADFMISKMGYALSQREYFNNPIQAGKVFKREWIQWAPMPPLNKMRALVAYLDPGFKKSATSDAKAWVLIGLHEAKYYIVKVYVDVASIGEMVGWGYALQAYCQQRGAAVRLVMEEVLLQSLLYDDFSREGQKRGAPLPLTGDKRKKPDKDARIEAISGHFERGDVYFNLAEKEDHHMKRLVEQFLNFQAGAKVHKDGPDAVEGGIHILNTATVSAAPITIGARHKSKYHR